MSSSIESESEKSQFELPHTASGTATRTIVTFALDDNENPNNWPRGKKITIVLLLLLTVINSTISSSIPAGVTPALGAYFSITDSAVLLLPISIYLFGYVLGPLVWGPASEKIGRRKVLIPTFFGFTLGTVACSLVNNWTGLIVLRFITGAFACGPITVVNGVYADLYDNPVSRGRAVALFMSGNTWGPLIGGVMSSFVGVAELNWRWAFWIALIFAGVSLALLLLLPETYGPVILRHRAEKLRKEKKDENIFAPIELESQEWRELMKVILVLPLQLLFLKPVVTAVCGYMALEFGVFYLFFEAYPIIFQGIYGMNIGLASLAYIPIGLGGFFAAGVFWWWDIFLLKAKEDGKSWASQEDYRRLPLACLGGPMLGVSLLWLGWTANENVHWIVPMLAGIPFGLGFLLVFMALFNYVTDLYKDVAASIGAAATCSRSIVGAVLPFVAKPMYDRLGVHWASSLLAFLSFALALLPFLFLRYGEVLKRKAKA